MDLNKVLAELRLELQRLDAAILSIERLSEEGRRRGRPPKLLAELRRSRHDAEPAAKPEGRRGRKGIGQEE
jgi:hypothetical protein